MQNLWLSSNTFQTITIVWKVLDSNYVGPRHRFSVNYHVTTSNITTDNVRSCNMVVNRNT